MSFAELDAVWRTVANEPDFAVLYESWDNYLRIAYGTSFADEAAGRDLFIRHTYLATLAKLMVWARLVGGVSAGEADDDEVAGLLSGRAFEAYGILNFLEEDFFAWVSREPAADVGIAVAKRLLGLLAAYDLSRISEDVFKGLYEQLVDPEGRHDLGEYYTPDWLAQRIVERVLGDLPPAARVLDPACGSGTFLYHAIRYKLGRLSRRRPKPSADELLAAIQREVVGIDVHPMAVIIAKANYVLALGELLERRRAAVAIPVYLADALRQPPRTTQRPRRYPGVEGWSLRPDPQAGITVFVPKVIGQPPLYDRVIDACRAYAEQAGTDGLEREAFVRYLERQVAELDKVLPDGPAREAVLDAIYDIAVGLREFIDAGRDTIQAFVLKNMLRPLFLRGQFHAIVGNPPWLSFRYIRAPEYQREIRELMEAYGIAPGAHLVTHMELATLFLLRCADWYLMDRGKIGFVLPRSIFSADQHAAFRAGRFAKVRLKFLEAWDLENVEPLFNVPACVVIAEKRPTAEVKYPLPAIRVSGRLPRRNASAEEASELIEEEVELVLHERGRRSYWAPEGGPEEIGPSPYKDKFVQGATIVPRAVWFVRIVPGPAGYDEALPEVETDPEILRNAKPPWDKVRMRGNVEREFLYPVVLATDLVPFGVIEPHLAVLPILPDGDGFRLLDAEAARREGFIYLAWWLDEAERVWESGRGAKAEAVGLLEWLDYRRKLTTQRARGSRVVYPEAGRQPVAAGLSGLGICDYTSYWCAAPGAARWYLSAVLCAAATDELLAELRRPDMRGHPHVGKKVFDVAPIPLYDRDNALHRQLAELGRECERKVAGWLEREKAADTEEERRAKVEKLRRAIGHTRRKIREMLAEELEEIDRLVQELLGL